MEYSVFDSVVMESTEYAMEAVSLKEGWKKFIAFCKKIIEKCKDFLRKIVAKIRGAKATSAIKDERITAPIEAYDASDVDKFLKEYQRPLVKFYDECYKKRTKALDAILDYLSNSSRTIFSKLANVNISASNDTAEAIIEDLIKINDNSEKMLDTYSDLNEELTGVMTEHKYTVHVEKLGLVIDTYKKGTKSSVFCTKEELQANINNSITSGLEPAYASLTLVVRNMEMQLGHMQRMVNSYNLNSEINFKTKSQLTSEINRMKTLFGKVYSNINIMLIDLRSLLKISDK